MVVLSPYVAGSEVALTLTPELSGQPAWTRNPDAPLSN